MSNAEISSRLEAAIKWAREAGELTLQYYRSASLEIETKSDASPVTIADRKAEELLRQRISAGFPDDAVLGEEYPEKPGTSGYRWILDPIDGTKSFMSGVPLYGTLIGIEHGGESVVGVVGMPALNEYYYGANGLGAWEIIGTNEPRRVKVSDVSSLSESLICYTAVDHFEKYGRLEAYNTFRKQCKLERGWGDCYGYMLVATGRAELMFDPKMSIWDCAALQPILLEAGGTFTDWQGNPTIQNNEGVATNGKILDAVLAVTKQHPRQA